MPGAEGTAPASREPGTRAPECRESTIIQIRDASPGSNAALPLREGGTHAAASQRGAVLGMATVLLGKLPRSPLYRRADKPN